MKIIVKNSNNIENLENSPYCFTESAPLLRGIFIINFIPLSIHLALCTYIHVLCCLGGSLVHIWNQKIWQTALFNYHRDILIRFNY